MTKKYLNWEELNYSWDEVYLLWEEVFILIDIVRRVGGSGYYDDKKSLKNIIKDFGNDNEINDRVINLICKINNIDYNQYKKINKKDIFIKIDNFDKKIKIKEKRVSVNIN